MGDIFLPVHGNTKRIFLFMEAKMEVWMEFIEEG